MRYVRSRADLFLLGFFSHRKDLNLISTMLLKTLASIMKVIEASSFIISVYVWKLVANSSRLFIQDVVKLIMDLNTFSTSRIPKETT